MPRAPRKTKPAPVAPATDGGALASGELLGDIRGLIEESRQQVATTVNVGMTLLYWNIGQRIRSEVLKFERAEYGKQIVSTLSAQLQTEYGEGFAARSLFKMMQFAEAFPELKVIGHLCRKLSWSHFKEILHFKDPIQRDFYAEMCRIETWSVRTLRDKIDSMLFERTALSKKPQELIEHELQQLRAEDKMTPNLVFRDPIFLDYLGLKDRYLEKDLEDAILRELENFILELGSGFSFVARQKRLIIDGDDHYIDLLFFHRGLRRLIAIELKLGDFKAADKGQMELYLRYLAKHEMQPGEDKPLGLILCSGKKSETIELLEMDAAGIHVAEYLSSLPSRECLSQRLHLAIEHAKQRFPNA